MESAEITQPTPPTSGASRSCWIAPVFFLFALLLLLYNLGGPALFEPDEGRNAEIAREILLARFGIVGVNQTIDVEEMLAVDPDGDADDDSLAG